MEGGKDLWEYDGMLTPPPLRTVPYFVTPAPIARMVAYLFHPLR